MRRPISLVDGLCSDYYFLLQQYNRKRQRRQAAAVVVQNLWNNNNVPGGDSSVAGSISGATVGSPANYGNAPGGQSTGLGRKSTAKPRPVLSIPPKGIGPVMEPNENDVLCGRGGRINSHSGNIQFRDIVQSRKKEYLSKTTKKLEKAHIAAKIVQMIRTMDPPGRFLKEERGTDAWYDIGDAKAIKKAGQALREDAPDIRQELGGPDGGEDAGSSDEEKKKEKPKKKSAEGSTSKKSPSKRVLPVPSKAKSASDDMSIASIATKSRNPAPSRATSGDPSMISVPLPISRGQMFAQNQPERTGPWDNGAEERHVTSYDYQAQMDMPPPHAQNQFSGQTQSSLGLGNQIDSFNNRGPGFSARPHAKGMSSAASVSRQAMEALAEPNMQDHFRGQPVPPENIAFGRSFYAPRSGTEISGGDNTISTVSGLSDNISGLSLDFGNHPAMPRPNRFGPYEGAMRVSSRGSAKRPSQNRAHQRMPSNGRTTSEMSSSLRSMGRSLSFSDMSNLYDPAAWKAIMDEEEPNSAADHNAGNGNNAGNVSTGTRAPFSHQHPFFQQQHQQNYPPAPSSALSSGVMSTGSGRISIGSRFSFGQNQAPSSDRWANRGRTPSIASGMSMASFSVGSTSSSQWMNGMAQAAMDDGRSIFSDMSAELHALDLASNI